MAEEGLPSGLRSWSRSPAGRCFCDFSSLLKALRRRWPEEALSEDTFAQLLEATRDVPVSAADHDYIIEIRLDGPSGADFAWCARPPASVSCREMAAWWRRRDADAPLAAFMDWMQTPRRAAGLGAVWTAIDIRRGRSAAFTGLSAAGRWADGGEAAALLAAATGRDGGADLLTQWEFAARSVIGLAGPLLHAGAYPHRAGLSEGVRLIARTDGFYGAAAAAERLGWEGDAGEIRAAGDALGWTAEGDRTSLSVDFTENGPARRLGVEWLRPGGWTELNPAVWAYRLRRLTAIGLCSDSLAEALAGCIGPQLIETEAGAAASNAGINHVKLVFDSSGFHAKCYLAGNMGFVLQAE